MPAMSTAASWAGCPTAAIGLDGNPHNTWSGQKKPYHLVGGLDWSALVRYSADMADDGSAGQETNVSDVPYWLVNQ